MKKAQILSALALAFALGVAVIPTASTYAATFVQDGKVVDNLNEKIEDAIAKAKDDCGYRLVNTAKTYYYGQYVNLINALDNAEEAIANAEKTQVTTADTGLIAVYAKTISDLKGTLAAGVTIPSSVEETIPTATKSYNGVVLYISNAITALNNKALTIADQNADSADSKAFRDTADKLQAALDSAEEAIDEAKEAQAGSIQGAIEAIKDEAFADDLTYDEAVKAANSLSSNNGFTTVAKVRNLMTAINAAQELVDTKATMPASDADKAIAAINKALNGGTVNGDDLPNKPNDGTGNDQNKAPNTGALTNAEGSASTTVAMVAGIATALTAAGAGVVAYRNARRSTRK